MLMSILYMRMIVSNGRVPKWKKRHPNRSDHNHSRTKIKLWSMLSVIYAMLTDVVGCFLVEGFISSSIIITNP
jgi:hypothetical protein